MKRTFSRSERNALYIASGGLCANCGKALEVGWHADHITPFSKNGKTNIVNGQALCPTCNLQKGASMQSVKSNKIVFRDFQSEFTRVALDKAKNGEKVLIADVHPGSGKTLAACAAADRLITHGYIDKVIVIVPRLNLAHQFELDWRLMRPNMPELAVMLDLYHRPNTPPLMLNGASGYVTTYQSLVSNPQIHLREAHGGRTLVIFDEADRLGVDYDNQDFTKSAIWAEKLGEQASMIFVMSGTPFRADNKPLLFAEDHYSKPDQYGKRLLNADVTADYKLGVRDGYLRRFDFHLQDGVYDLITTDGATQMTINDTEGGIGRVVQEKNIWQPMTDKFVQYLQEQKTNVHHGICGLIAANTQSHAKRIEAYINKKYPNLRVLIAVSEDGEAAHKSLRDFKSGKYDVLVTVSMAYIGYDHKPISVMLLLTSFRSEAYLRQLIARGLRMWGEVAIEKQHCRVVAPDDKYMSTFVHALREESNYGYQEREKSKGDGLIRELLDSGKQMELSFIRDAMITRMRAMGLDPNGDLTPDELESLQHAMAMVNLPHYSATDIWAIFKALQSVGQAKPAQPVHRPQKTMTEMFKERKSELSDAAKRCDRQLAEMNWGTTNNQLWRAYGKSSTEVSSLEEIDARIQTVQRWLNQGHYDGKTD